MVSSKDFKTAANFKVSKGVGSNIATKSQKHLLENRGPHGIPCSLNSYPFAFSKIQEQLVQAAPYASFQHEDGFLVRHHTKLEGGRNVYWVPREGIISCMLFESCQQEIAFRFQKANIATKSQKHLLENRGPHGIPCSLNSYPFAFSKIQEQLVQAAPYASFQHEDGFLVRHHTKLEGGRNVYWVPREGIISCSCHHFELSGILCRHALRVLSTGNCFQIPERYAINTSAKLLQNSLSDHTERVQLLQGMVSNLVTESAKSKDRVDIAMEHVSVLLSRIRDHPLPFSRYARNDCFT
ncbi:hypothetical protein L1987_70975 [Smallanthus sonchifolius]|uniref:Uncharacterized protein n=1 Tax=Smallanthus sonchifolius TaxID=185202 RepID=A0ACB9ARZ8_9ASTR|nr:hypothetical protein L1987_70975 [Smallanthus sonchifolius]